MNQQFEFESADGVIEVEVRYNRRRRTRMGLLFDPDGRLLVDAPVGTRLDEVRALLATHERWIRYRSRSAASDVATWFPRKYEDGVIVFYHGRPVSLQITLARRNRVALQDSTLDVRARPDADIKALVWDWYRKRGDVDLARDLERLVPPLPWVDAVPQWRHRFMRSQWGSCTGSGRLSLNTHLVKLPRTLRDYVLLHELCHLQYLNHGPRFYRLMDLYMPQWKDHRRDLNRYTAMLAE